MVKILDGSPIHDSNSNPNCSGTYKSKQSPSTCPGTSAYSGRRRNQRADGFFRPVKTLADRKTNQSGMAGREESALPLLPLIAANLTGIKAGEPGYMTC